MGKPNEYGFFLYIAILLCALGLGWIRIDPLVPNWFLFLLGSGSGLIVALLAHARFVVAKKLGCIESFRIDLGFYKI